MTVLIIYVSKLLYITGYYKYKIAAILRLLFSLEEIK